MRRKSPYLFSTQTLLTRIRHTRGTDLKLPKYATAGLTLGLGQTKDTTVQVGCLLNISDSKEASNESRPQ